MLLAFWVCACGQATPVAQTPEPSPEPTATGTPSPVATLDLNASATEVSRLWLDNGNCSLPCFWGITPGVTPASDVVELFHHLGAEYVADITSDGIEYAPVDPETMNIRDRVVFRMPSRDGLPDGYVIRIGVENERVQTIGVGGQGDRFLLASLLRELGQPDHVYVHVITPGPVDVYSFTLMLYYEEGIRIELYFEPEFDIDRRVIQACPSAVRPSLFLWEENYDYSLDRAIEGMIVDPAIPPRTIDEATELTIAEFTSLFADPESEECVETPELLWILL
jgi:hypothetical protein